MDEKHDIWISAKDNTFTPKMCAIKKKTKKKNLTAKLAFREFNAETYTLVKLKWHHKQTETCLLSFVFLPLQPAKLYFGMRLLKE